MQDVTARLSSYRECVRHLWNTHFLDVLAGSPDKWALRDEFDSVCSTLFGALVVEPLGVAAAPQARNVLSRTRATDVPVPWLQVVPNSTPAGTPIMINRDPKNSSGYWDHTQRVASADMTLRFVSYFDFDELAFRDFRYYLVRLTAAAQDDLVGRAALIECEYTTTVLDQSAVDANFRT